MRKVLVVGIIFLFIGMSVTSTIGISNNDDTTPPVTTCTLDPPEPNGNNSWYISDVNVTLNATDDISGVKEIRISICGDPEIVIPGNYVHFFFDEDCKDYYVDYWAIDNAGNAESKNRFYINIDKTAPEITFYYYIDFIYFYRGIRYYFIAEAEDSTSGMDRVEFYTDDVHQKTVQGPGPEYILIWKPNIYSRVKGFILKPEITEEYVKFYSILVIVELGSDFPKFYAYCYDKAGNMESDSLTPMVPPYNINDILLFQSVTLPSNYSGYIGRFFIDVKIN